MFCTHNLKHIRTADLVRLRITTKFLQMKSRLNHFIESSVTITLATATDKCFNANTVV